MINLAGYSVIEKIYEGARSIVYRGHRTTDRQPVVLKTHKTDYPTPTQLGRLKHECEIGQSFDSPRIIKYHGTEKYQNNLYLITEDFGATALSEIIPSQGVELATFLRIAVQLAEALGEIHRKNVIHKDIKPRNILINPQAEIVKIIDFGLSSQLNRENQQILSPGVLEGTLAYISPEQTGRMNRAVDYRTDFYSLGVTFYQLLTGSVPFQATDPMELVHAHIARMPVSPRRLNPDIPQVVSDIVLKLLAKTAEERYQSAHGLKADLEICIRQWQAQGRIEPFALGQYDISERFQIPQKLYGREEEIQTLLAAFDRIGTPPGRVEIMLVSGQSGIGKSVLVNEIHKPIVRQRGYFILGKFDQFQRNIPYNAILRAFQDLVRQLLTESEEKINLWRERLLAALGPNGQIIIDVIPDVALIIGPQPPVKDVGPEEAQNRFNLVFQAFIGVFAKQEHPLVIFLDDLQWVDAASLKLIHLITTNPDSEYLFFIGAYRENEVSSTHPLRLTLDEIEQAKVTLNRIFLGPLDARHVTELICATLACQPDEAAPLTQLVLNKTGGNPFFVNQFLTTLYEEKRLTFVPPAMPRSDTSESPVPAVLPTAGRPGDHTYRGGWHWDLEQIEAMAITDNVVELMAGKIQKLPGQTQHVLQLAACIGNQFDLITLARVNEASLGDTSHNLWIAIQEGLILQMGQWTDGQIGEFSNGHKPKANELLARFLHDRVQQAAYSLIPAGHEQAIHYKVGQLLLRHTTAGERDEKIFDIVNQLNFGLDLIREPAEQKELAELNLVAGRKAKAAAAYEPALKYLAMGLKLLNLNPDHWQTDYELSLALYTEAAEAAYLCTNFAEMETLTAHVLQQAKTLLDKVKAQEIRIHSYMAQNEMLEAIETARQVLKLLDISLPQQPNQPHIILGLIRTKLALGRKRVEDLEKLPEMTDPDKLAALRILMSSASAAYIATPQMFPLIVCHIVRLSVKYGNAPLSGFGYVTYGLILAGALGQIKSGYEFGQFAQRLMERLQAKELKAKLTTVFHGFISHWQEPAQVSLAPLLEGYQSGLETGDLEYAANNVLMYCYNAFACGRKLDWLEPEVDKYLHVMEKFKQERPLRGHRLRKQLILNLTGRAEHVLRFKGEAYDEETMLPRLIEANDQTETCVYYVYKSMFSYLFHDYEAALEYAELAAQNLEAILGQILIPVQNCFHSLALLALYPAAPPAKQKQYLKTVRANQKKLKKWADHAPANCQHKYHLVEAEYARVTQDNEKAMIAYRQAINLAKMHEYIHEEALANELAALFYLANDFTNIAKTYMFDARYAYLHWGASAKVQHLDQKYARLLSHISSDTTATYDITAESRLSGSSSQTTPGGRSDVLDLQTVIKASQAISGEIMLGTLLEKLMEIVIENAGAQTGFLILEKEGQLVIEAEGRVDKTEVTVLQSTPVGTAENPDLSVAIVNYVYRTRENVVLNDATETGPFSQDAYVIQNRPVSILCTPLINQGKLSGILYLENKATTGAFTPARLELLKLLSAQIAISIENASLYTNVEYSEKKYRALFEDSRDTIFITTVEGKIIDINPAGLELFGYTRQEILQLNVRDFYLNPDDRLRLLEISQQEGDIKDFETQFKRKDGTIIDCLITATVRQADDGRIVGQQGVIRDITERKRADKERTRLLAIQRELDTAHTIQASLLPAPRPDLSGLEVVCYSIPAREVGGDFYTYHAFEHGTYALAVGDISGKGLPAALLMSVSLASLQATIPQRLPPGELLLQLDRTLARYTRTSHQNCALCYLEVTPPTPESDRRVLRAANAGCIPPLIRRMDGQIEWVHVGGIPLGVELGVELGYREIEFELARGDLIILTSDGVVEAINEREELFGFERLEQAVARGPQTGAEAMLAHLKAEVANFVGQTEPHDDLTIVVAQV
jgi:PAS domain S-box-containing protein